MGSNKKKSAPVKIIIIIAIIFGGLQLVGIVGSFIGTLTSFNNNSNQDEVLNQANDQRQKQKNNFTNKWPPQAKSDSVRLDSDLTRRNFYVVLDGSGSMFERKCSGDVNKAEAAKAALKTFAQTVPADANLGLLVFDRRGIHERLSLGVQNREQFFQELDQLDVGGGTPLRTAMDLGRKKIEAQAQRQLGYGEYQLVVVTDGEASSGELPSRVVANMISQTPIVINTIGFCIGTNHSLNQPGKTIYKAANNPQELTQGLESVLAESESFDVSDFGL